MGRTLGHFKATIGAPLQSKTDHGRESVAPQGEMTGF